MVYYYGYYENCYYQEFNPSRPNPGRREKIKVKFLFSHVCGARKGKGLHKTFWGTAEKCENKNLTIFVSIQLFRNARDGKG